jgi:hypothetical protein
VGAFDFLLPGLLDSARDFTRRWRSPIEKQGHTLRAEALAARIRPFLPRRRKEDVAKELPLKTEVLRRVALEGAQRDLYETVRAAMDEQVRREITAKGLARSHIMVLDALLKLRQVCCDPRLLKRRTLPEGMEQAKLDALDEMLQELVAEGRRILVFSEFAEMLALIAQRLQQRGLAHGVLTGRTRDRQAVVQRFQQGEVPVFLVSLKAGGLGLNLTAADTVIHFDPWWNPAAEAQATDRAHRIGQDKPVFVYKLVAACSIEERILAMQQRKAWLALSQRWARMAKPPSSLASRTPTCCWHRWSEHSCLGSTSRDAPQVSVHHHDDQFFQAGAGFPAQLALRLARVTQEGVHFGRPEKLRIDDHICLSVEPDVAEGDPAHVPNGRRAPCGHHIVVALGLLEHCPHRLHVVTGEAPVALHVNVSQAQFTLQAKLDACHRVRDLAGHELYASQRRFVVEEDAAGRMQAEAFSVVHRHPVRIQLGYAVRAARIERRRFALARLLHFPEHFARAGLVEASLRVHDANGLKQVHGPEARHVAGQNRL